MGLYCGVDLHARNCYLSILDEERKLIRHGRLSNELGLVLAAIEPYREEMAGIVVESTFNWYWLVDGLMEHGYRVHLANTDKAQQYKGLKYTDDRHDARWLALMLLLGILPTGYIYPKAERPLRDLCRRRSFLVEKRTSMVTAARGIYGSWTGAQIGRNEMRKWDEEDLEVLLPDPDIRLGVSCLLKPAEAISEQIAAIEAEVLRSAKLREEFRKLETVWGIGKVLALTIMYEVGDISRFSDVGHFASYCRLVNTDRRSDAKSKGKGNRKNGNPYLSWAFSEAAYYAERNRPLAKQFAQRKKAKRNAIVANRALAHKLARASFYVMRDKVDFDPERTFR
jgi:transposase